MKGKNKKPTLSIIVPVFNEEKTVLPLLEKVQKVKLMGLAKQIVVVNDGSSDGTARLLGKVKSSNVEIYHHEVNRGKGAAIRTAIPHTTGDFVVVQDADLEYDPNDYKTLLVPLLEGKTDVVYGSRFMGPHRAFLFLHYVGNKFLSLMTNILYNTTITDMETCYKLFRGDIIRSLKLRSNRFEFEPEVTAKILKKGYKLFEMPISYHGRGFEEGKKITWRDGITALVTLIRYRFTD
ncbi:MAG TPA: glycosyltransferase family 2 protein [bacterium]|nr:glycosyltransferase family 2 protein [bacterium]